MTKRPSPRRQPCRLTCAESAPSACAQEQPARNPTDNPLRLAFSPASTARNASRVSAANDIDAAITITVASTYSALYP